MKREICGYQKNLSKLQKTMKFRRASVYKYLGFFYFEVTTEKSFDPKPVFIKLFFLQTSKGKLKRDNDSLLKRLKEKPHFQLYVI